MARKTLSDEEILRDIRNQPTVPIWPHYGWAYGLGRGKSYDRAQKGGDEFLRIETNGDRPMFRAISAVIRKKLGIEAGA